MTREVLDGGCRLQSGTKKAVISVLCNTFASHVPAGQGKHAIKRCGTPQKKYALLLPLFWLFPVAQQKARSSIVALGNIFTVYASKERSVASV